jgi:TetR/AcrR family transcriptional repressor of nem operon
VAGLEEFEQRGYHGASIEEIVRRAGVSKGSFYYYYRDKRDFASDLQRHLWSRLRSRAAHAYDPEADGLSNIRNTFHAFFRALRNADEARFFLREAWSIPDVDVAARALTEEWVQQTAAFLESSMQAGDIVDVDAGALASALIGAFSEATLFVLTTGKVDATTAVLDRMIEAFRR